MPDDKRPQKKPGEGLDRSAEGPVRTAHEREAAREAEREEERDRQLHEAPTQRGAERGEMASAGNRDDDEPAEDD